MAEIDPVTLEILWTRLITVANEQAAALQRTSFTPIVSRVGRSQWRRCSTPRDACLLRPSPGRPATSNSLATSMHHFSRRVSGRKLSVTAMC